MRESSPSATIIQATAIHAKYMAEIRLILEEGGGVRFGFAASVDSPGQKLLPQNSVKLLSGPPGRTGK